MSISVGVVYDTLQSAARQAVLINDAEDLSGIRVGLHDEIFQGSTPVLAGVDAASTYCYLLVAEQHRDADTWGLHLLDASARGLKPDHTIADTGQGLRAGPSGRRDYQRGQVYAWENRILAPRDRTTIAFAATQAMVDAIWSDMDLRYPPAVERLSRRATATIASANRLSLHLPDRIPAWGLLHEIAHAMSTTDDGRSDGHGPVFMGSMCECWSAT